jgi:hypothetical protein
MSLRRCLRPCSSSNFNLSAKLATFNPRTTSFHTRIVALWLLCAGVKLDEFRGSVATAESYWFDQLNSCQVVWRRQFGVSSSLSLYGPLFRALASGELNTYITHSPIKQLKYDSLSQSSSPFDISIIAMGFRTPTDEKMSTRVNSCLSKLYSSIGRLDGQIEIVSKSLILHISLRKKNFHDSEWTYDTIEPSCRCQQYLNQKGS